jgi:hypothetical protein
MHNALNYCEDYLSSIFNKTPRPRPMIWYFVGHAILPTQTPRDRLVDKPFVHMTNP